MGGHSARDASAFQIEAEDEKPADSGILQLPDRPSIAVLPLVNMGPGADQDYFSDGLTEDIITDLSKISGIFVIAKNSAFAYKGKSVTPPQVSRELGVHHILEGAVRRAGQRVRISTQLVDGLLNQNVWADRFDGSLEDIFDIFRTDGRGCCTHYAGQALGFGPTRTLFHVSCNRLQFAGAL